MEIPELLLLLELKTKQKKEELLEKRRALDMEEYDFASQEKKAEEVKKLFNLKEGE
jgi:hypothetical protein